MKKFTVVVIVFFLAGCSQSEKVNASEHSLVTVLAATTDKNTTIPIRGSDVPDLNMDDEKGRKLFVEAYKGDAPSLQKLLTSAEAGNDVAEFYLGVYFDDIKEDDKAFVYFTKSSDQGNIKAIASLGLFYEKGIGVPQNYAKAFELLQRAASNGNIDATYNLGGMFKDGLGVPKDNGMANMLFEKALYLQREEENAKRSH